MALALVAVALSATGLAFATIPGAKGVIHSCYAKSNGALRVVNGTRCRKGETKLKWNQQGVPGRRGATGPSDIYAGGAATGHPAASYAAYGAITLPPGSYLLEGKVQAIDSASGNSEVTCSLAPDTSGSSYWDVGNATLTAANAREIVALSAVQKFTATQHVEIVCKLSSGTAVLDDARVIAIRTGSLHGSTPTD
jgi:hypothetical protein